MRIGIKNPELAEKISQSPNLDLKKGNVINGKIISNNKGEIRMSLKGLNIMAKGPADLLVGQEIKLLVEDMTGENIILKIVKNHDEASEKNLEKNIFRLLEKNSLKLPETKIKEIIRDYRSLQAKDEKIDPEILKTLIFLKKHDLNFNEKIYKNLYAYFKKENNKEMELSEDLSENIKNSLGKTEQEMQSYEKGQLLINALNKKEENGIIEFSLFFKEIAKSVDIKIKKDEKNKTSDNSKDIFFTLSLDLEKFGKTDIKVNKYKKTVNILFNVEKNNEKIEVNKKDLVEKISGIGFEIGTFAVKKRIRDEIEKGVNIKV